MKDTIQNIIELIFPRTCINCNKQWDYLCKDCKKKLIAHEEICPVCHNNSKDYKVCPNCRSSNIHYEWIIIWFKYSWLLKKLILKLKYYHQKDITDFLAQRLNVVLSTTSIEKENSIISSVPSHWTRKYFIKWYNQSELLSQRLSEFSWINYKNICRKIKFTFSQTKFNRQKRLINLKDSFINVCQLNGNENIIIVDDITTTWSTINEIAKTIKNKYPNVKVWWLILWRHS